MDPNTKLTVIERLKQSNNVLVTVSSSPSVDQLASCIGLTLLLNKMGKHATAVFSGAVPSTIEFLKPENTLEKTTDSLRDFIISLDKSKADKLRYKVEDKVVKIFITPYRTTITDKDLEFSQGDFNVDVVLALGVHKKEELDQAITAHGRILHDATVISVNTTENGDLGALNWVDMSASSLCEMLISLANTLGDNLVDSQIATAFLTGIVAETARFSNEKATPQTMTWAGKLMSLGASSQLVATQLDAHQDNQSSLSKPAQSTPGTKPALITTAPSKDGELSISHDKTSPPKDDASSDSDSDSKPTSEHDDVVEGINIDEQGNLGLNENQASSKTDSLKKYPGIVTHPPMSGGPLTSYSLPDPLNAPSDPLSLPPVSEGNEQVLSAAPKKVIPTTTETLSEIEQDVHSAHVQPLPVLDEEPNLAGAAGNLGETTEQSLGSQNSPTTEVTNSYLPPNLVPPSSPNTEPTVINPLAPPPVPPPMMPPGP